MILADREVNGVQRKLLLHAPKNGLFYVLDRTDGSLLSAEKFAHVNWTTGVDPKTGRPRIDHEAVDYSKEPKLVYPSVAGAHNWNAMAFSPRTGLVYLPTVESGVLLYDISGQAGYRPGLFNAGAGVVFSGYIDALKDGLPPMLKAALTPKRLLKDHPDLRMRAYLQAWDPINQRQVWKSAEMGWWDHGGALATAGGLVLQGSATGMLNVFDASSGKLLKSIETGSSIMAAPMMYEVDRVTYVAVMAAWGGGGWGVYHPDTAAYRYGNAGRMLAFKLGGGAVPIPAPLPPVEPIPEPPRQKIDKATIARGGLLFGGNCAICHSNQDRGGAPDLRRMSPQTHASFNAIVLGGLLKSGGMPAWGDVLEAGDAEAIHAYLIDLAHSAYDGQQAVLKAGRKTGEDNAVIKGY
jgi:quinohemoprotein ethanol dehydrogenase